MATANLKIAASHFPVSGQIKRNARYIFRHMKKAAGDGVQVVHFPETALSGYALVHFESFNEYNWSLLEFYTQEICDYARKLGIWTVFGSTRRGSDILPKNCIYVISNIGKIEGIYDKQRLYNKEKLYYSAGSEPVSIIINGVKCGFLICYDSCYPELYDAYRRRGVRLLFHSYYNANNKEGANSLDDLIVAQLRTRAADNQMWICASNSSERHSRMVSCIVKPDGSLISAKRHISSIVIQEFSSSNLGWTYDNKIRR